MAKKNYYAVKVGFTSNVIVETWYECECLVKGCSGAIFKGFSTYKEALEFLNHNVKPVIKKPVKKQKTKYPVHYISNGIRHADYGMTTGINTDNLYFGDEPPWH